MDILGKIRNKINPVTSVNICMMGGKGTGKSSVLTSLYKNMDKAIGSDAKLFLHPIGNTTTRLNDKYDELSKMFEYAYMTDGIPPAGLSGDYAVNQYDFEFGMKGSKTKMNLCVKDFPGEYVEDYPEVVKSFVDESSCVIIAIDTPHLMEHDGAYNEAKNCCRTITGFIQEYLAQKGDEAHKLFLLVPLKCERYYYADCMADVLARVEACYSELIELLKHDYKKSMALAVTPILTVGDVVFDTFGKDKDGNVLTEIKEGTNQAIPAQAYYKYRISNAQYTPQYCEQPLLYMLSFIAKEYEAAKNAPQKGLLQRFKQRFAVWFKLIGDNPEFLIEVSRLKRKRVCDVASKGYHVFTGKNLI